MKPKFEEELYRKNFMVAIFGSARIKANDKTYKQVYALSRLIGQQGIGVVTGGGHGLMEAASSGHRAGKVGDHIHTVGLPIRLLKKEKANSSLDIKKEFDSFSKRLDTFMLLSNAVVVAPGGIGTSLELFYTWQLTQVKKICNIPIILMGDMWEDFLKWAEKWPLKKKFMGREDMNNIFLAKNPYEAIEIIKKFHDEYMKGSKYLCYNFQKYKLK